MITRTMTVNGQYIRSYSFECLYAMNANEEITAMTIADMSVSLMMSNRYSAKLRFGQSREGGFGTWHMAFGVAPHLERDGLLRLNWATISSLALDNSTVF